jgi:translation initiation factor 1
MSVCDTCGLPQEICVCEEIAREQQEITITTTTRRYGKTVTIVKGLNPDEIDVKSLTVDLKSACACGGSYKEGHIELQGDHCEKVQDELEEMGFHAEIR